MVTSSTCGSRPVAKRLGDATVRMLAYNGSIPGPTLKVHEGSEVVVNVENHGDIEATVHWHGLRLENRYDGTHETQHADGRSARRFSARVAFPDPGAVLVPPAHPRGLRPGDGSLRQRARRARPTPSTGHRSTARSSSRSTTSCWRTARSHRSAARRRPTRRWAASATCCSVSGRAGSFADRPARRGRPLLPDQHRQYAGVQGGAAGRAGQARRRRQRPCRARAVRRRRGARSIGARRGRRSLRPRRRARRWSITLRSGSIRSP